MAYLEGRGGRHRERRRELSPDPELVEKLREAFGLRPDQKMEVIPLRLRDPLQLSMRDMGQVLPYPFDRRPLLLAENNLFAVSGHIMIEDNQVILSTLHRPSRRSNKIILSNITRLDEVGGFRVFQEYQPLISAVIAIEQEENYRYVGKIANALGVLPQPTSPTTR